MGDSLSAKERVRKILELVDRGVLSVEEAARELYEDAIDQTPRLNDPDCARLFNDRMGLLIDACDRTGAASQSAGPVSVETRSRQVEWNERHDRWVDRRAVLGDFNGWDDGVATVGAVARLCGEAAHDGDDRFIEAAARFAAEHGSVTAVAAIVPVEDPDRFRIGAHHGSVTAILMLRRLAADGDVEAEEHLRRLAAVAQWTTRPLDG